MDVAAGELGQGLAFGVVATVFLAGLRHGFDVDHVAAITDIASSQPDRRRSLVLATVYALGHVLVVAGLGLVAVVLGESIPPSVDAVARRVGGLTLVALGLYVVWTLIRFRRDFHMQSRWMLVVAGVRRVLHRVRPPRFVIIEHEHGHPTTGHHDHARTAASRGETDAGVATTTTTHAHPHRHVVPVPPDPFTDYGVKTAFLVGTVHGVGAETPTQVLLFTTAAGVAGSLGGVALVLAFVTGLLVGNSVLALIATAGFAAGRRLPLLHMGLAGATAAASVVVGVRYLVA